MPALLQFLAGSTNRTPAYSSSSPASRRACSLSQYGVVKAAAPPQAPNRPIVQIPPEQLEEMQNPAIATNKDAWKQILQIGLLGLGTGAGTRALLGMRDLFSRPSYAPPKIGP